MVADELEDGQEWDGKSRFFADEVLFKNFREFARLKIDPHNEPNYFYQAVPVYLEPLEPETLSGGFEPDEASVEELTPAPVWEAFLALNREIKKAREAGEVFCWEQGDEIPRYVIEQLRAKT